MGFKYRDDVDIIDLLRKANYNTNRIRKEKIFSESTLQRIRERKMISLPQIEKICSILKCKPDAIIEYIPD